ncbi:MAG: DUF2357 domain-containing protein [Desulfotignum sp.]|nr:DUF2357 domain-containing protein [Desulfotignum sp.]
MFAYDSVFDLALGDSPFFPEKDALPVCDTDTGPIAVDEGKNYFIKFYSTDVPGFFDTAPFCKRQFHGGIWELGFNNFVGLSRIGSLHIDIQNRKISNSLYTAMLDELADQYAALVFSFSSPAAQHYSKSGTGRDPAFIQHLFLKKYLVDGSPDIDAISDIFCHDPHRKIEKQFQPCGIQECTAVNAVIAGMILNGPMAKLHQPHPLQATALARILMQKTKKALYPQSAARESRFQTFNTHENRFIKFFLQELLWKIEAISTALDPDTSSYFNPDISDCLKSLENSIHHFLSHNMWQDVGTMQFVPVNSQVLQKKEGYRQLFSLYSLLQLATRCDFLQTDFKNLVEIKNVPTLYEYWCFFQIKSIIDTFSAPTAIDRLISEDPIEHKLTTGLCITYQDGIKLFFNKVYGGSPGVEDPDAAMPSYQPGTSYSQTFIPDIVVEKAGKKLIFDAKYKGIKGSGGFYGGDDQGSVWTWKPEDINKMHTYREAISGVVGSFVLFPGSTSIIYPKNGLDSIFEGVGAFCLRPDSANSPDNTTRKHIRTVLSEFFMST